MIQRKTIFSRDFILVVIGQIISIFGNQILRYALPLYLLTQTGSSALFGTISATAFIPMILLFPIGGIIADRLNKKSIMVILDFSTAILIFLFFLLSGKMNIVFLMAITMILLYAIQGAYQPAVQASVPFLIEKQYLMRGNFIVNLINSVASMIGPVMGGILFSIIGLTPILFLSIACFFSSAVMEQFIHIPHEKKETKGHIIQIGYSDLKESVSFMFQKRPVLWKISIVYASMNLFLTSLVLIGLPVIITQHLGFTPSAANRFYGYAQGVIAAGSIIGGLLAGILSKKLKTTTSPILLCGCASSIFMGGLSLHLLKGSFEIYLFLIIGCGLLTALSTVFQIQIMSYIQMLTPKELTGKVISCVMCVCMCTIPLGQYIYGIVFEHLGNHIYIPFYVATLIMIGIIYFTRNIFNGMEHSTTATFT